MNVLIFFNVTTFLVILQNYVYASIVNTKYGQVRGRLNQASNGKNVKEFLGIPFAKPPLEDLRFRAPQLPEKWTDVLNATEYPNSCFQKMPAIVKRIKSFQPYISQTLLSEDCLYLNIWVPTCEDCILEKLPVMFFVYGGAFFFGSISCSGYDGGVMATEENVIVVTSNYRVGALGFMSLDDKDVPGNAGLLDQQMAMRWVHENIENFGGNPERVTLFGQSAGSASVNFHLVTPSSWGYFQGAILMSGFANPYWALAPKERNDELGWTLAGYLECKRATVNETLLCLQKYDGEEILNNEPVLGYALAVFYPVVDGVFLKEHPYQSYSRGTIKECNILTGVTKNEGTVFLSLLIPDEIPMLSKHPKPSYQAIAKLINNEASIRQSPLLADMIEQFYTSAFKDLEDPQIIIEILSSLASDIFFNCKMKRLLEPYTKKANEKKLKIFTYLYSYKLSIIPKTWHGIGHGFDLPLIFGHPLAKIRNVEFSTGVTEDDVAFTKQYMRFWANFARTGNPSISASGQMENILWPEYTSKGEEYLVLAPNSSVVGNRFRQKECVFQNKLLPLLIQHLFLTEKDWSVKLDL